MNPRRNLSLLILAVLITTGVEAAQRTFVSAGSGNDANPCTRQAPCRNFAAAMAQTDPKGEVVVLDSGGYGTASITQSVTLVSPAGVHAGVTAFSGDAITVNGADIDVFLRNLWINALGGDVGIRISLARQVHVESCTVTGFTFFGMFPTYSTGGYLSLKDSFLRLNLNDAIRLQPGGSFTQVTIDRTRIENNGGDGIRVFPQAGAIAITVVKDSLITSNSRGIHADSTAGGFSETNVEQCVVAHNVSEGLRGGGTSRLILVSETYITNNGTGVLSGGADDMRSFGNNRIQGNGTDGTFTSTIPLM